jgi:AbrB family looped-hinge helix DNA binding protein
MGIELKVASNGRIVIPSDVRKALGIENGGSLWLESTETELVLRTKRQKLARAQAMVRALLKDVKGSAVDSLIADRRAEFDREEAEYRERSGK